MTIQGWVLFGILALFILSFGIFGAIIFEKIVWKVLGIVAAMLLIIGLFAGMRWYYQNTASGQRAMTYQKSELDNGLERTVTIYTADGEIIAQYTGKIDIEGNDGGYADDNAQHGEEGAHFVAQNRAPGHKDAFNVNVCHGRGPLISLLIWPSDKITCLPA